MLAEQDDELWFAASRIFHALTRRFGHCVWSY